VRQGQRRSGAKRPLATAATANLKPFLGIKSAQLLVVQRDAFALQQDVQSVVTEAPPDGGDLAQTGSQEAVLRPLAAIADRARVRAVIWHARRWLTS